MGCWLVRYIGKFPLLLLSTFLGLTINCPSAVVLRSKNRQRQITLVVHTARAFALPHSREIPVTKTCAFRLQTPGGRTHPLTRVAYRHFLAVHRTTVTYRSDA